jgi:hypothetical protein
MQKFLKRKGVLATKNYIPHAPDEQLIHVKV